MENEAYRVHRDPTLKLKDGITITDVVGEKGAEFEVAEEFEDEGEEEEAESGYFNREEVFKNLSYICNDGGEDDEDDSSPFQRIEAKMEPITEDGGVQKMLLQAGFGNIVPPDSVVRVHYNAYLEFSDEPFDSTRLRNRVERFRLGTVEPGEFYSGEAIAGVSIAVSSMKRGELSRFLIKPEYGFGSSGCPPRIPPDATLMYEIELLSFVEDVGVDEISHLTMEERRNLTWAKVKQSCDAGRKEGNILFNETSFRKAQLKYRKAIDVLEQYHLKDEAEEREQRKLLLKLYLNISLCFLKQAHYPPTITYCKRALEIDCKNVKAQFRMGQALHRMGEFDAAKDHLKRAQKLEPKNPDINTELGKLARSVENFHVCETQMYQRMMKPSANPGREPSEPQVSKPNSSSLDDFRNVVRKKLIEMKDNPDMEVMPFPNGSLSPVEICCIMETADDLGLDIIRRGQEPNIQVLVKKKDAST